MNGPVQQPILIPVPESFESERLIIRMPLPGDGALAYQAFEESIEELKPFIHWAHAPQSPEIMEAVFLQGRCNYLARTSFRLHLFDKVSGEFVGAVGLFYPDWQLRKLEIGYWMRTKYAGKGLVTEAVEATTKFAIEELGANRLEIRCDPRNKASVRVAEKCGYVLEGILRAAKPDMQGKHADEAVYAKVRGLEF